VSLRLPILANYASQLYITIVGIVLVPTYVRYMGAEAYGLVAFFAMLQAFFGMLDLGLTPTIGRETARYHGGALSPLLYRQLFRAISLIFCVIAVLGGGALLCMSDFVASRWLNVTHIDRNAVINAVQIMSVCVALRWMGGLYRGAITGAERLILMSGFNVFIATLRFVAVLGSMAAFSYTPKVFFAHQLVVALTEVLLLYVINLRMLPSRRSLDGVIGWSIKPVFSIVKFAMTITFTSSVWVLVTQTDKLILSGILPLADYGFFTMAIMIASGVTVISTPITASIWPRMSKLAAEANETGLLELYRQSTQLVAVVAIPTTVVLVCFASPVLLAWTGSAEIAAKACTSLQLYALGNGVMAFAAFPYYLQFAKGDLKLHLIGNVFFVVALIPGLIWATTRFGMNGAGWAWLLANTGYFVLWVPRIHKRFAAKGFNFRWVFEDILPILVLPLVFVLLAKYAVPLPSGRIELSLLIALVSALTLAAGIVSSPLLRTKLTRGRFIKAA
jgi:O-antigen/teichoic acid export membrane protein